MLNGSISLSGNSIFQDHPLYWTLVGPWPDPRVALAASPGSRFLADNNSQLPNLLSGLSRTEMPPSPTARPQPGTDKQEGTEGGLPAPTE